MDTNIPEDEIHALLYLHDLHDWDESGKIYPEVSGLHRSYQAANEARKLKLNPDKYYIRIARFKE